MVTKEVSDIILLFVIIAIVIILHHIFIHSNLSFPARIFQISDISNHETWAIAFLALAIGCYIGDMLKYKN